MTRHRQVVAVALGLIVACVAVAATVYALSASSPSYRLVETVAAAKGFASGPSYTLYTSTGQPTPVGVTQSASYKAAVGFLRRAALTSGGAVPLPVLLDPDITDNGTVDLFQDIFGVASRFGAQQGVDLCDPDPVTDTDCYDPKADLDANGLIDLFNDIFGVALAFGTSNWPPFNSVSQPVTVTVGSPVRFYVVAPKDSNDVLPQLEVVGGVSGQSFTVDAGEVNGNRRGKYEWTPASVEPATQLTFRATYGSSSTEVTLWLRSQ
ncbi:MAG: hypothetical protein Q8R78_07555 [Candidatus Omnitrophota bacterium]|nr:hypothetical protein [Candidatus Omnitrophota bacterium]